MVSPSGHGASGTQRCGQAADRRWAASPSSLHGRPLRLARMRCERGSVGVVLPASSRSNDRERRVTGMRIIGLDIHRAFAEAVAWKDGKLSRLGRVIMRRERLEDLPSNCPTATLLSLKRPAMRLQLPQ